MFLLKSELLQEKVYSRKYEMYLHVCFYVTQIQGKHIFFEEF